MPSHCTLPCRLNKPCVVKTADHHSPSCPHHAVRLPLTPAPTSLRLVFHRSGIINTVLRQAAECIMSTAICASLLATLSVTDARGSVSPDNISS